MSTAKIWDATASGGGAWVPAIIGTQGNQGFQGVQGSQGVQGYISPLTTKGDIFTYSTSGTRVSLGNEAESLTVLPNNTTGNGYFPAQINIQKLTLGGHSYTSNFLGYEDIASGNAKYYNTSQSTYNHLLSALNFESDNVNHMGVGGTILQYDLTYSGVANGTGGWAAVLRNLSPTRARAPYTNDNGLCIGIWGINDIGLSGHTGTTFLPPFIDALRTVISRFRASTVSKTTSTTGRQITSNQINTGTNYQAFQLNDVFSIALPSDYDGGAVALNFIGGGNGTVGGTVTIVDSHGDSFSINGNTPGTTNQFTTSGYGISYPNNTPRVGQVARINGLTPKVAHTLTCTVTSASTTVDFDSWQLESSFPNPVIIANIANIVGSDPNSIQQWNDKIQSLVTEFLQDPISPNPITIANIQNILSTYGTTDGVHPNELSSIYIAEEVRKSYTRMNVPLRSFISSSSNNITSGFSQYPMANFKATRNTGNPVINSLTLGQTNLTPLGTWSIDGTLTPVFTPQYINIRGKTTYFIPIKIVEPCSITQFTCISSTGATSNSMGFGLYYDWLGLPGYLMFDAGTIPASSSGNRIMTLTTPIKVSTPGVYWIALYTRGSSGNSTNLKVAALTGADPLIVNSDSPASGLSSTTAAPLGSCLYIDSTSASLPAYALGLYSTDCNTCAWSPMVYITLTGNY